MLQRTLLTMWLFLAFYVLRTAFGFTPLSDDSLRNLPIAGKDFDIKTGGILAPILIPRVPGTPGSKQVQQHFVDWFSTHLPKWTISYQNSTAKTPATGDKDVPFVNIIITRDPPWTKPGDVGRLALVAHYDSKLSPAGFIGAVDSAAPTAMIMHAARSVDEALTRKWAAMEAEGSIGLDEEKGLQILLLDGEEAFLVWTDSDSLYGARSLAESWESTFQPATSTYQNPLDSISLFLLLDLLGSAKPRIPSYFPTTHWAYQHLASAERRLRTMGLLASEVDEDSPFLPEHDKTPEAFRGKFGIQDDHLPFMARGVDILHVIPTPFPRVWHTLDDDGEHLDIPTVEDWAKILTAFVAEWMDLEGHFASNMVTSDSSTVAKRAIPTDRTELDGL